MSILDKWLDRRIAQMGYVKAGSQLPPVLVAGAGSGGTLAWDTMDNGRREALAMACAWVYSDVQYIVNEASQAEFYVEDADGQQIDDHPYAALRRRPNPDLGAAYLWQFLFGWLLLRGQAYEWLLRNTLGEIVEIWPVPASSMAAVPDPERKSGHYISHFRYTPPQTGVPIDIPYRDVVYYRRPNIFDLYGGQGFLDPLNMAVQTDRSAAVWNRDGYGNEMTVRTGIFMPAELSDPLYNAAREEIRRQLIEEHARYIISRTGQLEVKQFGVSPKDAEYLSSRTFNREEIDRVLGFPAGFWAKEATRANSDAARAVVIGGTVWPCLCLAANEITAQVLAENYDPDQQAHFTDIRPADRELLLQERQQYWQVYTVDECRADVGKEPLPNGQGTALFGTKGNDAAAQPVRVVDAGAGKSYPVMHDPAQITISTVAVPSGPTMAAVKADLRRWEGIAVRRARGGEAPAYDFASDAIPEAARRLLYGELRELSAEAEVKALFAGLKAKEPDRAAEAALRKRVLAVLQERLGPVARDPEQWQRALAGLDDELRAALTSELAQIVRRQVLAEALLVGVDFDEAAVNQAAVEWARQYSFELVKGLTEVTRAGVEAAVTTYLQTPGMTQADLEALLEPTFGAARAESIGTTEVTRALSQATTIHKELLAEAGVTMEEVWNTSNDDIVCPICGPLNGKSEATWQSDHPAGPPAHPRCRCWKTLRVKRQK